MNKKQKAIIICGIVAVIIMFLFPHVRHTTAVAKYRMDTM